MKKLVILVVVVAAGLALWKYVQTPKALAPSSYKVSDFVGTWHTERNSIDTLLTMNADGTFRSEGKMYNKLSQTPTVTVLNGKWALDGDAIAWEYEATSDAGALVGANKERNPVVQYSRDSFTMRELTGAQTRFDRQK